MGSVINVTRYGGEVVSTKTVISGSPPTKTVSTNNTGWKSFQEVTSKSYVNNKKARPCSDYSATYHKYTSGIIRKETSNPSRETVEVTFPEVFDGLWGDPMPTANLQKAKTDALRKMKDGGMNLAVFAAESNKALAMVANRIGQIVFFARKAKRAKSPEQVQNIWLELQYGWKPLMQDIEGGISALTGNLAANFGRQTFIGRSKELRDSEWVDKSNWSPEKAVGVAHLVRTEAKAQYVIIAQPDNVQLAKAAAIGLTNPLSVAWELIPFSFVVDWFIPIGNLLEALDASIGWTFVDGCYSTKLSRSVLLIASSDVLSGGYWRTTRKGGQISQRVEFRRYKLYSFPSALGWQGIKSPFSTLHCANALALLTQTFRSR